MSERSDSRLAVVVDAKLLGEMASPSLLRPLLEREPLVASARCGVGMYKTWFCEPSGTDEKSSGFGVDGISTQQTLKKRILRLVLSSLAQQNFTVHLSSRLSPVLELLESLPRGTVEASIRLMRGYTRTGEWPEPILPSPAPERGRSPAE